MALNKIGFPGLDAISALYTLLPSASKTKCSFSVNVIKRKPLCGTYLISKYIPPSLYKTQYHHKSALYAPGINLSNVSRTIGG